jgi:hypothetical protein
MNYLQRLNYNHCATIYKGIVGKIDNVVENFDDVIYGVSPIRITLTHRENEILRFRTFKVLLMREMKRLGFEKHKITHDSRLNVYYLDLHWQPYFPVSY